MMTITIAAISIGIAVGTISYGIYFRNDKLTYAGSLILVASIIYKEWVFFDTRKYNLNFRVSPVGCNFYLKSKNNKKTTYKKKVGNKKSEAKKTKNVSETIKKTKTTK